MTVYQERSSCRQLLCIKKITILVGFSSIFLGISTGYFLFFEAIPLAYRKFHLMNGAVMAIMGGIIICGVLKRCKEAFWFFMAYQCITLFLSSLAIVFALISDADLRTFIVMFHEGIEVKKDVEGIEPRFVPGVLTYLIVMFYVVPVVFLCIALRCYFVIRGVVSSEENVVEEIAQRIERSSKCLP
ncbi:hypothetical protein QR680_004116 [Steinernema hermaphroditum]|uniref:Uncharacterized protein n=1 Tax=Steinernema hermaphroditum TaxID=289476 RepID=A0AA39LT74_9BILA|nr:hypothetical protein QR680_004116 [Steinernema hermaphroditum]